MREKAGRVRRERARLELFLLLSFLTPGTMILGKARWTWPVVDIHFIIGYIAFILDRRARRFSRRVMNLG